MTPFSPRVLESKFDTPFQESVYGGLWNRRLMLRVFFHWVLRCSFHVR